LQRRVRPFHPPCHVPRGEPSVIVPPLPQAVPPHLIVSVAPHRVASRPRGVSPPLDGSRSVPPCDHLPQSPWAASQLCRARREAL
jgi:hypothetical protein